MAKKLLALVMALAIMVTSCVVLSGCKEDSSYEGGNEARYDVEDEEDDRE